METRRIVPLRAVQIGIVVLVFGSWVGGALRVSERIEVTTAAVTEGPIVRRVVATGTLQALTTVQVGSQLSGNIASLHADFNSIVRKGQVLAQIDSALFQSAVDQARANLQQAKADLAQAGAGVESARVAVADAGQKQARAAALALRNIDTQADLDAANIALDTNRAALRSARSADTAARQNVRQAHASLDQALVNLNHCTITAPIDGIVIQRSVDVGQTVAASVQAPVLFVIAADLRRMQIEVDLDESDVGGIKTGEGATFEVESYPDEIFHGQVGSVRLQPVAEQTTTATTVPASTLPATATLIPTVISYPVMITVDNPDEKLRPGMTATVMLNGSRLGHAVRIPNNALSFRPAADVLSAAAQTLPRGSTRESSFGTGTVRQVWRYDGRHFSPVTVTTGLTDNEWTELVGSGVRAGDPLVTSASVAADHGL